MNAIAKLRYKTKVGLLLAGLLLLLLVNNIAVQDSFLNMQRDATSIYEDRLMPSTFLFDIREQLYQGRLTRMSGEAPAQIAANLANQRNAIAELITRYEKTVFTKAEKVEWMSLKTHLQNVHSTSISTRESDEAFTSALTALNNLKLIQAGEGAWLQKDMTRIATISSVRSYVEVVLLIIIGSITLSLIGYSRNVFDKTVTHRPSMN